MAVLIFLHLVNKVVSPTSSKSSLSDSVCNHSQTYLWKFANNLFLNADTVFASKHNSSLSHIFATGDSTQLVANWLYCGYILVAEHISPFTETTETIFVKEFLEFCFKSMIFGLD